MKIHRKSAYDRAFDGCVNFLENLARLMNPWWPGGMDYRKINVMLFRICLPLILVSSLVLNIILLLALGSSAGEATRKPSASPDGFILPTCHRVGWYQLAKLDIGGCLLNEPNS